MNISNAPQADRQKLEKMLDPTYPLRKEELIWFLEYIKKKVADKDPNLTVLPQPRLYTNFLYFAELALLMIHHREREQDSERLKQWIREAAYGLLGQPPSSCQDSSQLKWNVPSRSTR